MKPGVCSIHIYYNGNQDQLLTDAIMPLLFNCEEKGVLNQYFFLRYWNGGNHIRLRLFDLVNPTAIVIELSGVLDEFVKISPHDPQNADDYERFAEKMKTFYNQIGRSGEELIEPLHRQTAVLLKSYNFETDKYGAGKARTITENHFAFSTKLAYQMMMITRNLPLSRLTLLIYISMMTAGVIDRDLKIAADLFHKASDIASIVENSQGNARQFWLKQGLPGFSDQVPALTNVIDQVRNWQEKITGLRNSGHSAKNAKSVNPLMDVPGQNEQVKLLLQDWQIELYEKMESLNTLKSKQPFLLDPPHILMNYLHLLFNRLGVPYTVECYVYYLVANTIDYTMERTHLP